MNRKFSTVSVGDRLPTLEMDISMSRLVMYAAATWDFHRYHYDYDYVTEKNISAPFLDGQMVGALLARQLMQWGGADAFVRKLKYRVGTMVFAGERIAISGEVTGTAVEDGRSLALCKLDVVKIGGGNVVDGATASIELL